MKDYTKTYCNPLPIPDYPIGRRCLGDESIPDFRELADPTVLYYEGKWYLYPSCGMAWVSGDFINWEHIRIDPYDFGYAPTVVYHRGKFYMTACLADVRVSDSPLGPFEPIGAFTLPGGEVCGEIYDPMMFSDDDGRLYLYFGSGGQISGAELDPEDVTRLITEPVVLIDYDPSHEWERIGDWNEDASYSWIEGAWMYKKNGTYYLTYAAPGTEWRTYAMGAYKGSSPLGHFEYMKTSPFLHQKYGLVKGPGHGCLVDGPGGTTWAFFTCLVCYCHEFERRIGMDPIGFDENGDIIIKEATETPQWAPGVTERPEISNGAGLLPLTSHRKASASSSAPGRDPIYAVDDSMLTWWEGAPGDPQPTLTVKLADCGFVIESCRIVWRDVGLDVSRGVLPGAFGYKVEAMSMDGEWVCVSDRTDNTKDMLIDYFTVTEMRAKELRLTVTSSPNGITPGVINFCVFGKFEL